MDNDVEVVILRECDLCVVGTGYAGINALNAATKYLPKGARVIVIGRESHWGGQWVDQYDFVTLHQPYRMFTAGERQWDLAGKPYDYLATKPEILRHFRNIAKECQRDIDMDLVELFEYECTTYEHETARIKVCARPLSPHGKLQSGCLPHVEFRAKKFIFADGGNIPHKPPLQFSTSVPLNSITPADCLTPEMNIRMTISPETRDKPIYVIGSGKTAVDVMKGLNKLDGIMGRIRCISGRGTTFLNRSKIAHTKFDDTHFFGRNMSIDNIFRVVDQYNGADSLEGVDWQAASRKMHDEGILHTFCEDPQSFMLGICSPEEIQMVKDALHPREEKIVKAHLLDIIDGESGSPQMKLRTVDTKEIFYRTIEPGAFIINCTDHFLPVHHYPILSPDNLVLRPQMIAGFTGPSANIAVHLWYRGLLQDEWKKVPRFELDHSNKLKMGFEGLAGVALNMMMLRSKLPLLVANKYQPMDAGDYPFYRLVVLGIRMIATRKMLTAAQNHVRLHKMRYTDPDHGTPGVPASYKHAGDGNYAYGQIGINPRSRL